MINPVEILHYRKPKPRSYALGLTRDVGPTQQEALFNHERIRADSLAFFENLVAGYKLPRKDSSAFGEGEFFSAASELTDYISNLRESVMPDWKETRDVRVYTSYNSYMGRERHPADRHLEEVCNLFFQQPKVKSVYMQIQLRKMQQALPEFMESIADSTQGSQTQGEYFQRVTSLMNDQMQATSHIFTDEQIDILGLLIGYQEKGMLIPTNERRKMFVSIGNETFTSFLARLVSDALENGQDIHSAVRRELLERDGIGFTMMRTHLKDFPKRAALLNVSTSMEEARERFSIATARGGACPAIGKINSHDGSGIQRPIVYEYASVIVTHMPEHLQIARTDLAPRR